MSDSPLATLNDAQRRAVAEGDGAALVLAGAGSGKTRVIVERLAWLIQERGVDARRLLALTFTNKAANEMRERVAARLGAKTLPVWVGTFHSFGVFLLRREIEVLRRGRSFTIFDDTDQLALMKRLIQALPAPFARVSPRNALWWISHLKQDLKTPEHLPAPRDPEERAFRELWNRYHGELERVSAVDFDDLLVLAARILDEHPSVRERYQHRFAYIHVDEYQDTNRAQYVMAKLLSGAHGNLFVVGDEDQAIYSWRGANIRNILEFERDFPEAKVFRLEQNYRSTAAILEAANALVAHNTERLGKTLWTKIPAGEPVRYRECASGEEEAAYVASAIIEAQVPLNTVAILFRTNAQSRLLEEALRRKNLPYVLVGGTQFYARKEVKDLLAYLRLIVNPADDVSFRRIVNVPSRGIGDTTLERIEEYAAARGVPLLHVVREIEHDETLSARARASLADFLHLLDDLAILSRSQSVAHVVKTLIERTAYVQYVARADEKDARSRTEVVEEFVSACASFGAQQGPASAAHGQSDAQGQGTEKNTASLEAFLQELALASDVDTWDPNTPAVTLMTCHSAKGLEFDSIFLVGLEEGLLPHASALDSDRELEEERRLCYVAMTRARKRLTLCSARERVVFGEAGVRTPSRFLRDMPAKALERVQSRPAQTAPTPKARAEAPARTTETPGPAGALRMGMRVRHATFGPGTVMYTSGSGPKQRARIRFETGRTREFVVGLAPLEIVEGKKR